jgi:tRNA-2-methylthio-N6-dimethylallyladenosine synthase
VRGRWKGRTPTNKLVFVESSEDLRGQVRPATITWAGPWSMQGRMPGGAAAGVPLELISVSN